MFDDIHCDICALFSSTVYREDTLQVIEIGTLDLPNHVLSTFFFTPNESTIVQVM